ncbi:hypothetical protein F4604DRAFT_1935779 [Suillus subluteus]|nr:hypothetical protein F4604DRAFT_1935779 [Suillus subluteus]
MSYNIVINLQDISQQLGVLSDLYEAIKYHRAPLLLRPTGHIDIHVSQPQLPSRHIPAASGSLNNLARSVQTRFEQRGALPDYDETIELYRAAPSQRAFPSDVEEAIELTRAALALYPPGCSYRSLSIPFPAALKLDSSRSCLTWMSSSSSFELSCVPSPGPSDQFTPLDNFPSIIHSRFEQQLGIPSDLDESIELHQVELTL